MPFDATLLLSQAYRPFFPLAALFTAISVFVWLCGLSGLVPLPPHPSLWHAHEMLFGFATAVIIGFSMTAVVNWTGLSPATPRTLGLLLACWAAARIFAFWPSSSGQLISAAFDVLVLVGAALLMTRVLVASRNQRNLMFIPLLWGLALINLGFHASLQFGHPDLARKLITLTAWLIGFLMVFMGGRVIPFFSARRKAYQPVQWNGLNWLSTIAALATALSSLSPLMTLGASCALVAAISTALRLLLWKPWRVLDEPMLWILHLGYLWLATAYGLHAANGFELIHTAPSLALHAILAGGLGCLGLGMMTRVALGHSGREITAGPFMGLAFVMVVLAGLVRMGSYLPFGPVPGLVGLTISALLWCFAFSIYFVNFAPMLWRTD